MDIDDIETITVLGAGNMGHGISEVAALAGYSVNMRDISEDLVQSGYEQIEWSLGKLAEQDRIQGDDADAALERITPVVDLSDALADADFLIEAVPERMDIKRDVYAEVTEVAPEHTVFASNTSSLSVTELSEATDRPTRFCGLHFFNPPVRMQLVEVIRGAHTDDATLTLSEALTRELGKTPIRVRKDSPGFIVNRVLVPLLNEATWLVASDEATIAEVDSTTKYGMGLPMGAFELADQVGNDVTLDVLEYMHDTLGDAYAPCPLLREKVEAGAVGRKAGEGFYDYENGGVEIPSDAIRTLVETRLAAVMANEAAKLIENDVSDAPVIDQGLELGAAFPTGPAALADEIGLSDLHTELKDRYEATNEPRYEPTALLTDLATSGRGFYETGADTTGTDPSLESIQVDQSNGVGRITLDREHRMNAITLDLLDELDTAITRFERDETTRVILITGAGDRAFSVGADTQQMASGMPPAEAVELSRRGQAVFGRLEKNDLPVLAGIDGYALGGGMELAASCDLRLATDRSTFGQPEHNLGLLPGWGGTQRLRHIVGDGRAKEIIFTADHYDAETMAEYGFLNDVVSPDDFESALTDLAEHLAAGPPLAQRYTKRAMHHGRHNTDAGLEIEAEAFGVLLSTDDLIEGITAFMDDRDPEFEGT